MSRINSVQLSEKHSENSALERNEWNGRLRARLAVAGELTGVGSGSSSTPSASNTVAGVLESDGDLEERSCRSW